MVLKLYLTVLFVLSVIPVAGPETDLPTDKAGHFIAYGIAAVLISRHLSDRKRSHLFLPAVCWASLYGLLMEIVQYFVPYRSFSPADAAANAAGAAIFAAAYSLIRRRAITQPGISGKL